MSSSSTSQLAKRVAKGLYTRIPFSIKSRIESVLAPLSFRWFTRGIIDLNAELGEPPYRPVSIVIPSYNDVHLLKPLLKSLHKTLQKFEYEIIISDDFCQERNSEKLISLNSEKVRIIFAEQRTGFAGAVNRGINEARFDVILLNSDIIALDYWAENLQAAAYNIDPKIGLVSPHLLYPTGRIQYGGTFHAAVLAPQWFSHLDQGRFANDKFANVGKYVTAISGACVYIKRELLEHISGLDEGYWLGFEDVDLAFSARELGFRSYLEPSSKLIHLESASRGKVQGFKEYSSLRRFWNKWRKHDEKELLNGGVQLFYAEDAPLLLSLLAEKIADLLREANIDASIHKVSSTSRIDEDAISVTSPVNTYKVALDKQSIETVWLSSEVSGIPILYSAFLALSELDVSNPQDLALLKPEFTFIFGNPGDQHAISALVPWSVEKTVPPPAFAKIEELIDEIPALLNPTIHIVGKESSFTTRLEKQLKNVGLSAILCSQDEVITLLLGENSSLKNDIIVFADEFDSLLLPLTLSALGVLYISVFSEKTKFEILDGFNTLSYTQGDADRATFLVTNLALDQTTQRSIRTNGSLIARSVEKNFTRNFLIGLNGRKSEVLPHH